MSYVPGFEHDAYISYAHVDNLPIGDQLGWVDQFQRSLEVRLAQMLGRRPSIFRDAQLRRTEEWQPAVARALQRSALLVCVLSPGYLQSEWCLKELEEFRVHSADQLPLVIGNRSRILKVLVSPVPFSEQPKVLGDMLGYEFYISDPASGRVKEFRHAFGKDTDIRFWERLDDLAYDIRNLLHALRENRSDAQGPSDVTAKPQELHRFQILLPGDKERRIKVFLCHASNDKPRVRSLYKLLRERGVDPWLDEENLLPGQLWESEIQRAVRECDAVVVCLSKSSVSKKGYVQKEIKQALDVAEEFPEGIIFLIPARFEECEIPERISKWHWVNLYEEKGTELLLRALEARTSQISVSAEVEGL